MRSLVKNRTKNIPDTQSAINTKVVPIAIEDAIGIKWKQEVGIFIPHEIRQRIKNPHATL